MVPPSVEWWVETDNQATTAQTQRVSLFGHIVRMPDKTDAKKILTSSFWRTRRDHQDADEDL